MKIKLSLIIALCVSMLSCTRIPDQPPPQDYEGVYKYPKNRVYQSSIEALTNIGMMIQSENIETGVITATGTYGKEEAKQMTNFHPSRLFVAMSVLVKLVSDDSTKVSIRTAMSGKRTPTFNTIMWGAIGYLASESNPELTSNGKLEKDYMNEINTILAGNNVAQPIQSN